MIHWGENSRLIRRFSFLITSLGLTFIILWKCRSLFMQNWGMGATVIIVLALVLLYWGFENSAVCAREIGIIAVLASIAAAGRVPFAFIPSVQPTTFMVLASGLVFGSRAGFMVGATAALVSNFFLGQGPWTPIQMLAWGMAGASAGLLGTIVPHPGRFMMCLFSFIWGYGFGWLMNLWFWTCFVRPLTWPSFLATYAASLPFDTLHGLSNAALYIMLGPQVITVLKRFQKKCVYTVDE